MKPERITNYYTFDPDIIGTYLAKNDWVGCWTYVCEIIESLSTIRNFGMNMMLQGDLNAEESRRQVEEFGRLLWELIFVLLQDSTTRIPDKSFFRLMSCHETLHSLCYLYGSPDVAQFIFPILDKKKTLTDIEQKKLLLLFDMRMECDIVSILRRTDTNYRVAAIAAYSNYVSIYDTNIYQNKIRIYELRHDLVKSYGEIDVLNTAVSAYFNCSYLDIPNRHIIKDNINKSVQLYINGLQRDIKRIKAQLSGTVGVGVREKPRMIVLMDFLYKNHAMTRSWSEWVRSLSTEFDVTVMVSESRIGEDVDKIFDDIRTFKTIQEMIALCQLMSPDICVFPSVGMTFQSVVASNMRLAPVQIMGLGHPATTYSPYIDFVYGPRELYHPDAFPTDRYIIDNSPYKFFPLLPKEEVLSIQKKDASDDNKNIVRVAIVGTAIKLSNPFINLLREIETEASYEIHFEFSMASVGVDTLCLQKFLNNNFKHVTFYGACSYPEYLSHLKDADIVLNPFPFGHTNTVIDTMLMGIPCVCAVRLNQTDLRKCRG